MPLILVSDPQLAILSEQSPGLVIDCGWCENGIARKYDRDGIVDCTALGGAMSINVLRICSSYVERK